MSLMSHVVNSHVNVMSNMRESSVKGEPDYEVYIVKFNSSAEFSPHGMQSSEATVFADKCGCSLSVAQGWLKDRYSIEIALHSPCSNGLL